MFGTERTLRSSAVRVLLLVAGLLAFALERSLSSESAFESLRVAVDTPWWWLTLVVLVWAAAQHVLAGVHHLLMDIGIGSPLAQARTSAWAVILTAAIIAVILFAVVIRVLLTMATHLSLVS